MDVRHLPLDELNAGLPAIRQAPADDGEVRMIARRPALGDRELLEEAELSTQVGLVGDNWETRGQQQTPPREPNPEAQLTLMGVRAADLVAGGDRDRWALAGDQLYVDLDLSRANLPPGSRVRMGDAIVEITAEPHPGCKKFVERFGMDAMTFVNSEEGRQLCLRGVNAKVIQGGTIRVGDPITKA